MFDDMLNAAGSSGPFLDLTGLFVFGLWAAALFSAGVGGAIVWLQRRTLRATHSGGRLRTMAALTGAGALPLVLVTVLGMAVLLGFKHEMGTVVWGVYGAGLLLGLAALAGAALLWREGNRRDAQRRDPLPKTPG